MHIESTKSLSTSTPSLHTNRDRRKGSKGGAIAYLPQGQTGKKVMVISSCGKAQKGKTLTTSYNI